MAHCLAETLCRNLPYALPAILAIISPDTVMGTVWYDLPTNVLQSDNRYIEIHVALVWYLSIGNGIMRLGHVKVAQNTVAMRLMI
jgi:hypothetical protein